jgi:hypothetical protein
VGHCRCLISATRPSSSQDVPLSCHLSCWACRQQSRTVMRRLVVGLRGASGILWKVWFEA